MTAVTFPDNNFESFDSQPIHSFAHSSSLSSSCHHEPWADSYHDGDEMKQHRHTESDEEIYDDDGNLVSVGNLVFVPNVEPLGTGSYGTVRLARWIRNASKNCDDTKSIPLDENDQSLSHLSSFSTANTATGMEVRQKSKLQLPRNSTSIISFGEDGSMSTDDGGAGVDGSSKSCSRITGDFVQGSSHSDSRSSGVMSIPRVVGTFGHFVVRLLSSIYSPGGSNTYKNEEERNQASESNHSTTVHGSELQEKEDCISTDSIDDRGKGKLVAVKILSKSILKRMRTLHREPSINNNSSSSSRLGVHTALERVEQEIALMKLIRHPNIVALQHVIDSPDSDALYMVLDFAPLGEIMSFDPKTVRFQRRPPPSRADRNVIGSDENDDDYGAAASVEDGVVLPGRYFNEHHAALYFVDVMHGLAYLHQHHVCHRDLKPENILLEYNKMVGGGVAKISDFGVSHFFEEEMDIGAKRISWRVPILGQTSTILSASYSCESLSELEDSAVVPSSTKEKGHKRKPVSKHRHHPRVLTRFDTDSALQMDGMSNLGRLTHTEGTWCFWSPEMCSMGGIVSNSSAVALHDELEDNEERMLPQFVQPKKHQRQRSSFSGYASDIWAAGICLFIFATGRPPFYSDFPEQLFSMISECDVSYKDLGLSAQLVDLLVHILEKDPNKRFGIGECLKHRFCRKARRQRIESLGEELRRVHEIKLIVKKEDLLNAFSIAKLADGAAKMILGKHRTLKKRLTSDRAGHKRKSDMSLSPQVSWKDDGAVHGVTSFNRDASDVIMESNDGQSVEQEKERDANSEFLKASEEQCSVQ